MTTDIHNTISRFKLALHPKDPLFPLGREVIDALEALAGEVERLKVMVETNKATAERVMTERDRLEAALVPFARFAKMFVEAREHKQGHVPVEPNAEWYARETKQGIYVLTPGMFDEALEALGDAS